MRDGASIGVLSGRRRGIDLTAGTRAVTFRNPMW
jgi:hypothetical protein